jgi:hypothetical protein
MSLPRLSRRQIAMVAATIAPLVLTVIGLLALRIRYKLGTRPLDAIELLVLYVGVSNTFHMTLNFRRQLINPAGRWGIFGRRQRPRLTLRLIMVYIASLAPMLAVYGQMMREHRSQHDARAAEQRAFYDQQIAWSAEQERENVARAQDSEKTAAEYRRMEARGEKRHGSESWGELAKHSDEHASFWRQQAASDAPMRKDSERSRARYGQSDK